ncbi:ATP-dependent DNA helicase RecG [uncultured Roseobacter sp.]|uniref:ATP-dependent DNA helicase RecG n=1 Tax=uncultured Roseobacter sp. TaxID=114847 RepID=UPI00262E412D|nr:ATP-dependent DNA helicase RecG [uncultured Roseobacter sp.]
MSGRPEILFPLFAGTETLAGIGPRTAQNLQSLGIATARDLLLTLPYSGIDRRPRGTLLGCDFPCVATVEVRVGGHQPARSRGGAYRIRVSDAETDFQIVFFHSRADYLQKVLPEGSQKLVSGKVEVFDGVPQMVHPDHIADPGVAGDIPVYEPVYPLTSGVTQKQMYRATRAALERVPTVAEWIDPSQMATSGWPAFAAALSQAHAPLSDDALQISAPARERLAYDELFAHQITLALARARDRQRRGRRTKGDGQLQQRVLSSLPYEPTSAQSRAVREINTDLAAPTRMNRLLQGDVGAGKTIVAFLALLRAVEAGGQGVLMAPTEILARQHLESLADMAATAGVSVEILTGRDKGAERKRKLSALAGGHTDILLGTHAVFQSDVVFADLRVAVIDEQHRFGVRQRLELGRKGEAVDVLVMTATPIPRSLALARYGDMDVSVLDEKPPGRKPVKTALISDTRLDEVTERLRNAIAEGRQCYWVCPLVEESEAVDLTAAEARFRMLRAALGEDNVGLVHGQMPAQEKDAAMARFQSGQTRVLVATTVIEVGVNVPSASIMVIERAEIFGLAQLHQLRGRVGRGAAESTCLLMYHPPLSDSGQRRLEVLRETEDGFVIADTDLKMRGAGDVIGTAQSGMPRFRIADPERQAGLMAIAQSDARRLLHDDPGLETGRGAAARVLLWLMSQEEAIRLISVG